MIGQEGDDLKMTMDDIHVHGEVQTKTDLCPTQRSGFWLAAAHHHGKPLHCTSSSCLPIWNSHGYGTFGGVTKFTNMHFHNFLN